MNEQCFVQDHSHILSISDYDNINIPASCIVEMASHSPCKDPLKMPHHNIDYEQAIKRTPSESCQCCHRFLFPDQIHKISKTLSNRVTINLNINSNSPLCTTCKSSIMKAKNPYMSSSSNDLDVPDVPSELTSLNRLEKRLVCKILTCMTMITLPAGQYAEKGLVINLPVNVNDVV